MAQARMHGQRADGFAAIGVPPVTLSIKFDCGQATQKAKGLLVGLPVVAVQSKAAQMDAYPAHQLKY